MVHSGKERAMKIEIGSGDGVGYESTTVKDLN